MVLHIEEIGRSQVLVALGVAGDQARDVDFQPLPTNIWGLPQRR
jgi:hypothetical protein